MKINDRLRWFEYEFPIAEAEIIFYSVFNSILSFNIWPCRDSHGIFDLAIFEFRPYFCVSFCSVQVYLKIGLTAGATRAPGAQKSDSRVPFQHWPKMGGEGGPVPPTHGEPGGAVWKPFSCVLRPSALGRPFSAVSSVLAERFHPSSSSLTIGISPDSVGTFCLPPPILAAKNIFCS